MRSPAPGQPALFFVFGVLLLLITIPSVATAQDTARTAADFVDSTAKPEVFAPGVLSTPYTEWSTSFSPDGLTVYTSIGAVYWTIVYSKQQNGRWMKPQVAAFSGRFRDTDPFVSPDGRRLFCISNRPLPGQPAEKPQPAFHVWFVEQAGEQGWTGPKHLDSAINPTGISNYAPSVSADGTLYYCSRRNGSDRMTSFYAARVGDRYGTPQQLLVPGSDEVQDPFIAPDGRYLLFTNGGELYISYRKEGKWQPAEKAGAVVNSGEGLSSPYVSRDGRTLYYSCTKIRGFYKRNPAAHALTYDEVLAENNGLFNNQPNILMIPVHLEPKKPA